MSDNIHYTTARRQRYLEELPLSHQVGCIIDELRALRLSLGHEGSETFSELIERIDAIKAEIPR